MIELLILLAAAMAVLGYLVWTHQRERRGGRHPEMTEAALQAQIQAQPLLRAKAEVHVPGAGRLVDLSGLKLHQHRAQRGPRDRAGLTVARERGQCEWPSSVPPR